MAASIGSSSDDDFEEVKYSSVTFNLQDVSSKILFPVYEQCTENLSERPTKLIGSASMFPAYSDRKPVTQPSNESSLDWLSLTSFPSTHAKALLDLQSKKSSQFKDDTERIITSESSDSEPKEKVTKPCKKKKKRKSEKESDVSHSAKVSAVVTKQEPGLYEEINKKTFIEDTGLALERAFRLDRKPDYENLSFDTFYQMNIARYRTLDFLPMGIEIGSAEHILELLRRSRKKKRKRVDSQRYFSSVNVKELRTREGTFLPCPVTKLAENLKLEYLPLQSDPSDAANVNRNKECSRINPLGIYDSFTEDYLSGISIRKESFSKNEVEADKPCDAEQNAWQRLSNKKTEDFNRRLRENPKDEKLWIDFVSFQDELVKSDPYGRDKLDGKRLELGCLERKLAILDRALHSNPRSTELAVLRLNTCQFLWEREKLSLEWKKLTFHQPGQPKVWQHYLRFLHSSFSTFSVKTVVKGYMKAITTLIKVNQGTLNVHSQPPDLELKILELLSDYASFLLSSGYSERAFATFQALVEFNFFPPNLPSDSSHSDWVAFFEPFWDSGVARVGEENAKGWGEVVTHKLLTSSHSVGCIDLNESEDILITQRLPDYKTWREFELLRDTNHWLPWRPDLEESANDTCEDPERMVSVDDVTCLLFPVQSEINKFKLILFFLSFLGISIPWSRWTLLDNWTLVCIPAELQYKSKPQPITNVISLQTSIHFKSLNCFISRLIAQIKPLLSVPYRLELDLIFVQHQVQELLVHQNSSSSKVFTSEVKSLKMFVKSVLSEEMNRNNLDLWMEYLRLELSGGNFVGAQKVFGTIFGAQIRNANIWRFVWAYLKAIFRFTNQVSNKHLLGVLVYLTCGEKYNPNNTEFPPVLILKARTGFDAAMNGLKCATENTESLIVERPSNYASCCLCYSFFLYFWNGFSMAEKTLTNFMNNFVLGSTDRLELHIGRLHLLIQEGSPLKPLQSVLDTALKEFPSSATLLALLLDAEGPSYLAARTRNLFSCLLSKASESSVHEWVFALLSELRRLKSIRSLTENVTGEFPDTGIIWKIRSLFEKALKKPSITYSGIIWRIYIQFEMDAGNVERAKSIFYRSLQNCPECKLLYMDAVHHFPDNLKLIVDLIAEKNLRLRTPLEEVQMLMEHENKSSDVINVIEEEADTDEKDVILIQEKERTT